MASNEDASISIQGLPQAGQEDQQYSRSGQRSFPGLVRCHEEKEEAPGLVSSFVEPNNPLTLNRRKEDPLARVRQKMIDKNCDVASEGRSSSGQKQKLSNVCDSEAPRDHQRQEGHEDTQDTMQKSQESKEGLLPPLPMNQNRRNRRFHYTKKEGSRLNMLPDDDRDDFYISMIEIETSKMKDLINSCNHSDLESIPPPEDFTTNLNVSRDVPAEVNLIQENCSPDKCNGHFSTDATSGKCLLSSQDACVHRTSMISAEYLVSLEKANPNCSADNEPVYSTGSNVYHEFNSSAIGVNNDIHSLQKSSVEIIEKDILRTNRTKKYKSKIKMDENQNVKSAKFKGNRSGHASKISTDILVSANCSLIDSDSSEDIKSVRPLTIDALNNQESCQAKKSSKYVRQDSHTHFNVHSFASETNETNDDEDKSLSSSSDSDTLCDEIAELEDQDEEAESESATKLGLSKVCHKRCSSPLSLSKDVRRHSRLNFRLNDDVEDCQEVEANLKMETESSGDADNNCCENDEIVHRQGDNLAKNVLARGNVQKVLPKDTWKDHEDCSLNEESLKSSQNYYNVSKDSPNAVKYTKEYLKYKNPKFVAEPKNLHSGMIDSLPPMSATGKRLHSSINKSSQKQTTGNIYPSHNECLQSKASEFSEEIHSNPPTPMSGITCSHPAFFSLVSKQMRNPNNTDWKRLNNLDKKDFMSQICAVRQISPPRGADQRSVHFEDECDTMKSVPSLGSEKSQATSHFDSISVEAVSCSLQVSLHPEQEVNGEKRPSQSKTSNSIKQLHSSPESWIDSALWNSRIESGINSNTLLPILRQRSSTFSIHTVVSKSIQVDLSQNSMSPCSQQSPVELCCPNEFVRKTEPKSKGVSNLKPIVKRGVKITDSSKTCRLIPQGSHGGTGKNKSECAVHTSVGGSKNITKLPSLSCDRQILIPTLKPLPEKENKSAANKSPKRNRPDRKSERSVVKCYSKEIGFLRASGVSLKRRKIEPAKKERRTLYVQDQRQEWNHKNSQRYPEPPKGRISGFSAMRKAGSSNHVTSRYFPRSQTIQINVRLANINKDVGTKPLLLTLCTDGRKTMPLYLKTTPELQIHPRSLLCRPHSCAPKGHGGHILKPRRNMTTDVLKECDGNHSFKYFNMAQCKEAAGWGKRS